MTNATATINPFLNGGPDPDFKVVSEDASSAGYNFKSADDSNNSYFQGLTEKQKADYAAIRLAARDKLKLHFVIDDQGDDGAEWVERYMVHEDGRYIMGVVIHYAISLSLWDDFGDDNTIETAGSIDAYLETVQARFDKLWSEYAGLAAF